MSWMGISVSNALLDTIFDIFLGVLGGAAGAWAATAISTDLRTLSHERPPAPSPLEQFSTLRLRASLVSQGSCARAR